MKSILIFLLITFSSKYGFSQSYYYTYAAGKTKFTVTIKENKAPKPGEKKWEVTIFDVYDQKRMKTNITDNPLDIYPFLASEIIKIDKGTFNSTLYNDPNRESILQEIYVKFITERKENLEKEEKQKKEEEKKKEEQKPDSAPKTKAKDIKLDSFTRRISIDTITFVSCITDNENKYTLIVCNESGNKTPEPCYNQSIDASISISDFKIIYQNLLKKHYAKPPVFDKSVDSKIEEIFTAWREEKTKKEEKKKSDAEKNDLEKRLKIKDSLLNALASENPDAALLKLIDSVLVTVNNPTFTYKEQEDDYREKSNPNVEIEAEDKYLFIDSVTITTQNNTFNQIDIVGKIDNQEVNVISNFYYGIPLRKFIDGREIISFEYNGTTYWLKYSSLFLVRPGYKSGITYTLRDSVYVLYPQATGENKIQVKKMRFLDFISASAFVDLFSLNNQNVNKNLNTEINIGFPINHSSIFYQIRHVGGMYHLRQIGMNVWIASDLGEFSNNEPALKSYSIKKTHPSGNDTTTNYVNNFDLLKHSFLRINPILNIASLDVKRWGSFFNLDFGLNWFASKVEYIDTLKKTDSLVNKNIFAFSPELNFKWKINPTQNFGADLQIGYLWNLRSLNRDIVEVYGSTNTRSLAERNSTQGWGRVLKFEMNFYFNPSISISNTVRGGWYIKTLYYKSLENVKNHFQFMVGYSSDIRRLFRY